MKYQINIETPSYLCDRHDRLHPWAAVRLCQEVTEYHGNATGIGFQTLKKQQRAWVITRALYNIYRRPNAFEPIELSTWSRGNNGLVAFREYRMQTTTGELLLSGTSYWALIDLESRRVVRMKDLMDSYQYVPECATEHTALGKIPARGLQTSNPDIMLNVKYSMLDHTRHVNNSEYIKWIFDSAVAHNVDIDHPFCLRIEYHHETHLDEPVEIYGQQTDNLFCAEIHNPAGRCTSAEILMLS